MSYHLLLLAGFISLTFLSWVAFRHVRWWREVLIPSWKDSLRRGWKQQMSLGKLALGDLRVTNHGKDVRSLYGKTGMLNSLMGGALALEPSLLRDVLYTALTVEAAFIAHLMLGGWGMLLGPAVGAGFMLVFQVLVPFVAERELQAAQRRNKWKADRLRFFPR